jgi:nucleotide-binding universal stress UspA family protein
MFSKILVPLDRSTIAEQILPHARLWARALHVPVELMTVIDVSSFAPRVGPEKLGLIDTLVEEAIGNSQEYLKRIAESFPGTDVKSTVDRGRVEEIIIDKAAADTTALVAMGTHGRSGINRWLLGSVAEKVLRAGRNPLLLVRSTASGGSGGEATLRSIVVPLDGSELSEQALPYATLFAKELRLSVVLVRSYDIRQGISAYQDVFPDWEKLEAEAKAEATAYLDDIGQELRKQGVTQVARVVTYGDPAGQIIELAGATANSFVAMGTHGRSGVQRWTLGSITEKVARHSAAPVLVIRAAKTGR